jgi:hypothetical protein
MNELEPDAYTAQWRWFAAAVVAMSVIAAILMKFPV